MLKGFPKRTGILVIPTWTHAWVGISYQTKIEIQGQHKWNSQKKMWLERSSTASKLGLKHLIQFVFAESQLCDSSTQKCAAFITWDLTNTPGSFRYFSAMSNQFIFWYGKKTSPRMGSLVSRYPTRWNNTVCNRISIYQSKQICRRPIEINAECSNCQTFKGIVPQLIKQCCFYWTTIFNFLFYSIYSLLKQWGL